jgi:hypothetical protein
MTAEERTKTYEDAKAKRPKVLFRLGIAVPEVLHLSLRDKQARRAHGLQSRQTFKSEHKLRRPYVEEWHQWSEGQHCSTCTGKTN